MAAEKTMPNIDIQDFPVPSGVSNSDYVLISQQNGTPGRVLVSLFKEVLTRSAVPYIKDGFWWIGDTNLEVPAQGKTPEFRRGELGVEYRYTGDSDSYWSLLIGIDELTLKFQDLTEEQRAEIALNFSDLTEEEIIELKQPAIEAGEYANKQGDFAKEQAEFAKLQGDYAKEQGETATENAEQAKQQAEFAKSQGDYAKEQGDYAASINERVMLGVATENPASILD